MPQADAPEAAAPRAPPRAPMRRPHARQAPIHSHALMKKKIARLVALAVAVLAAIAVMWTCTGPAPVPDGKGATAPVQGSGGSWDPNAGSKKAQGATGGDPPDGAAQPESAAPVLPTELAPVGTEVAPGAEVSVVVPWKRGDVNRFHYDITDLTIYRDRDSGQRNPTQYEWHVLLEVADGDGTGAARLRLTAESLHVYGFQPSGLPFDVNSRDGTTSPFFEIPEVARQVKPVFALLGQPLEFVLDRTGNVADLRGLDAWRDRFTDQVRELEKGGIGEPADLPTRAQVTDMWSEYLFPRIGGGTLKGGATRPWTRVVPEAPPWCIVWTGTVAVTRDDPDAFRVDVFAAPEAKNLGGAASGAGVGIAKVRAIGTEKSYHAAYRFGRAPGALLEAQIDASYQLWVSRPAAGAPGSPTYSPTFNEVLRRVIIRRTPD